jgi:hypothetical protein
MKGYGCFGTTTCGKRHNVKDYEKYLNNYKFTINNGKIAYTSQVNKKNFG